LSFQSDITALNAVFDELANYAIYHFQTEETVWHQYLALDVWETEHKVEHRDFVKKVIALKSDEVSRPLDEVIEDVLKFLTQWLVFHILESDMRMANIVLAIESGMTLQQAKAQSDSAISGAMKRLISSMLIMYNNLSARSLSLVKEMISRQKAEAKLRLAANVVKNTFDAICVTDANANIIEINPAFTDSTQYTFDDVRGLNLKAIKSGFQDDILSVEIWSAVANTGHWCGEISSKTKTNLPVNEWLTLSQVKDDKGLTRNYVAVFSDITRLIKKQHQLVHIAHHDSLTSLPNRLSLPVRLDLAIASAKRNRNFLAVCYLDLDGFKSVNDVLGHAAGDHVLWEISERMLKLVRGNDSVIRLGGDEFVLLFGDIENPDSYKELLDRMLFEIEQSIQFNDVKINVSASIGVTIYPLDNEPETLLDHADQAMYEAKQSANCKYVLYYIT
jgi:diguanylate cyclase (GGDEF)-like protein/hemerythrin-like metal-binding protein/PAS domain S-box-containing protein